MKKIALHSVPRSGSTWLGSILDSNPKTAYRFQPLFSYSHKDALNEHSSPREIDNFFKAIYHTKDDFVLQKKSKIQGLVPDFPKLKSSHIIYKEVRYHHILENLLKKDKNIKVIGLVRNPLATINSWLKAPREFKRHLGWDEESEWLYAPSKNLDKIEEFNGYEKWKEVARLFDQLYEEYNSRFYLLNYSDLITDCQLEVSKLFNFCELEYSKVTSEFIEISSSSSEKKNAYSVYRKISKDDDWKTELNPNIINFITDDLQNDVLNKYI